MVYFDQNRGLKNVNKCRSRKVTTDKVITSVWHFIPTENSTHQRKTLRRHTWYKFEWSWSNTPLQIIKFHSFSTKKIITKHQTSFSVFIWINNTQTTSWCIQKEHRHVNFIKTKHFSSYYVHKSSKMQAKVHKQPFSTWLWPPSCFFD